MCWDITVCVSNTMRCYILLVVSQTVVRRSWHSSILGSRAGAGPWLLRFQGAGRDTAIRFTIFVICVYFVSKLIYTGMIFCGCKLLSLQWRHNEHDGVSNHQPHDYLLNRLFRRRSKKTPKLRLTGLCVGSSPVTGEFPAQRVSNAENVSIYDVIMMSLPTADLHQNRRWAAWCPPPGWCALHHAGCRGICPQEGHHRADRTACWGFQRKHIHDGCQSTHTSRILCRHTSRPQGNQSPPIIQRGPGPGLWRKTR